MFYILTICTLFIAIGCGFGAALWINKRIEKS